ncbi:MAG: cation diffusion facilitator family transporter [Mediterranea sp.]|nr:cation diffusion facilitator family transporter [Mediterranea sp.]
MADTKADAREREIYRVTLAGSVVNLLLLLFKFVAGIAGHSAAMVADAVHSLSDFATDMVVILFVHISSKPEDAGHDYGHGKYETLATAIIGLALLCVGIGILWNGLTAVWHFWQGDALQRPGGVALAAALVSVLSKEAVYRYTIRAGRRCRSQAVIANAWHHRSDALSSIGTAIGIGGAFLLGERWCVLDPLAAIVVSIFIIRVAIQLLVPCINELLEKSLPPEIEEEIEQTILSFPGVCSPHHLRTRRIGNHFAMEVHVRMDGHLSLEEAHRKATEIEIELRRRFGNDTHIGIHVEPIK